VCLCVCVCAILSTRLCVCEYGFIPQEYRGIVAHAAARNHAHEGVTVNREHLGDGGDGDDDGDGEGCGDGGIGDDAWW
jgi:hypothetical protein